MDHHAEALDTIIKKLRDYLSSALHFVILIMEPAEGFEPPTRWLQISSSGQLSYAGNYRLSFIPKIRVKTRKINVKKSTNQDVPEKWLQK